MTFVVGVIGHDHELGRTFEVEHYDEVKIALAELFKENCELPPSNDWFFKQSTYATDMGNLYFVGGLEVL